MKDSIAARPWWRELEFWLLILLVAGVYFTRLPALSIRGEESRRAGIAWEMMQTGDWIVPREQGEVFADRPPLGNWVIAWSIMAFGEMSRLAVRLPSAIAVLLTTLLIYACGRSFLPRAGAMVAAAGYATMGQVLELGRLAENEAPFTLLVAGSQLCWLWGYVRRWNPWFTWSAGYALAAAAALTKGPQGPIYFAVPVVLFLLLVRDWRALFSRQHLAGMAVFVLLVAAWQIPHAMLVEPHQVLLTWTQQAGDRFHVHTPHDTLWHLVTYPLEVIGCMLPWSLLLLGFASRSLRNSLGEARQPALFLAVTALTCFLPVWMATDARGRYFMPLYPCLALLAGIVAQRSIEASAALGSRRLWPVYLRGLAGVFVVVGVALAAISLLVPDHKLAQPAGFALLFAGAACVTAAVIWRWGPLGDPASARWCTLAVAGFLGLSYTGAVVNALAVNNGVGEEQVALLKRQLPADVALRSLDLTHHQFRFHFRRLVERVDPAQAEQLAASASGYFCFDGHRFDPASLPFAWEQVSVVSCDRNRRDPPQEFVIVGRVIEQTAARAERPANE